MVVNEITGASLASNQITLPAGTYWVVAESTVYNVNYSRLRFQGITDGAPVGEFGLNTYSTITPTTAHLSTRFTSVGSKVYELQHWVQSTVATNGFGIALASPATEEVYSDIKIWKIG